MWILVRFVQFGFAYSHLYLFTDAGGGNKIFSLLPFIVISALLLENNNIIADNRQRGQVLFRIVSAWRLWLVLPITRDLLDRRSYCLAKTNANSSQNASAVTDCALSQPSCSTTDPKDAGVANAVESRSDRRATGSYVVGLLSSNRSAYCCCLSLVQSFELPRLLHHLLFFWRSIIPAVFKQIVLITHKYIYLVAVSSVCIHMYSRKNVTWGAGWRMRLKRAIEEGDAFCWDADSTVALRCRITSTLYLENSNRFLLIFLQVTDVKMSRFCCCLSTVCKQSRKYTYISRL